MKHRSTLPNRTKPMKRTAFRSKGTRGSMFPKRRDRAYTNWIRTFPCVLFGKHVCYGPVDPAHVFKTRAVGAYDLGEVVPLCRKAHREQEGRTIAFGKEWGVDLRFIAKALQRWYEQEIG